MKRTRTCTAVLLLLVLLLTQGCVTYAPGQDWGTVNAVEIPPWSGEPYAVLCDNVPAFEAADLVAQPFEEYGELDDLGRCTVTWACVSRDLMPTEPRGDIGSVKPTGWVNESYDFVDGKMLYNRCHLIGFQLTGENANKRNLVTGTRYMNVQGMLPFENMVADHVKEEGHHVLYRVIPHFIADELVCRGVAMEAQCVECQDSPYEEDWFQFHVYCYNVQPGVEIDYQTGGNRAAPTEADGIEQDYVLNTSSKKFHLPGCSGAQGISEKNREEITCTRQELIQQGYEPCGNCKP